MALQRRLVVSLGLIFIFISSFSCNNSLQHEDDSPYYYNNLDTTTSSGYDTRAYLSYLSTMTDEDGGDFFDNLIQLKTDDHDDDEDDQVGSLASSSSVKMVKVDDYGAKGDGKTDDAKAFTKAWQVACSSTTEAILVVPQKKTYLLKPIKFSGSCKSKVTFEIYGTIEAWGDRSAYSKDLNNWIVFDSVSNLLVEGGGTIDGNGNIWWQNSCKINKSLPCKDAPTAITFNNCKNLIVKNMKIKNAQQMHVRFQNCMNVQASNLMVTAPKTSPNTDGIHVTGTQNIQITNCVIGTGDDCISIVSGSQKVQVTDITCGPGHGISIGSLGAKNSEAHVSDVVVNRAKFTGTSNGVRIKTWQGGSGSASNIRFQNIVMNGVTNPIIIDQNYCDQDSPCKEKGSAVQVKNVVYQNIKGTSASDVAVTFDCSKSYPCQGIVLQDVNIGGTGGKTSKAVCNNVKHSDSGVVSPKCP